MTTSLACLLCAIDVQATSLLLPIAQATLISAPILMRKQLAEGVRRLAGQPEEPDDDIEDEADEADSG
jgi:hypothetical protein